MFVIGLTGGIGTGKTEASRVLQDLGSEVLSADEAGHEVYRRGTPGWHELVDEFGQGVLSPDGEVDHARLGAVVFQDDQARKRLNAIVHPRARSIIERRLQELEKRGVKVVVLEVPLLLEAGWEDMVNEVWVTTAPEGQVVERVQRRNRLDVEAIMSRISSQMPQEARIARADVVINNRGSLPDLREQVRALWQDRIPGVRKHTRHS